MYGVRLNLKILFCNWLHECLGRPVSLSAYDFEYIFVPFQFFVQRTMLRKWNAKQHFPFSYSKITTTHNTIRLHDDPLGVKKNEWKKQQTEQTVPIGNTSPSPFGVRFAIVVTFLRGHAITQVNICIQKFGARTTRRPWDAADGGRRFSARWIRTRRKILVLAGHVPFTAL